MVQALLMGLLALLNGIQGPYHWYFFREPVMAGFWVGLIYGDPVQEPSSVQQSTFLIWAGFLQEEQMLPTYTGQVCSVHL